ncbi:hypothetical protein [Streptomyces sp. NBC_01233]|uniref:hypothetical protein n=1 Tax=Streptomyces sp. NBC_01233 TaxID=2903787 RepID=UPI002E118F47|nr:hypothetical protein OG332_37675 [Streptomyces sp. NBC_01233]
MSLDHVGEEEDDRESVDSLISTWEHLLSRLRRTGDEVRALHARMTPWHGPEPRRAADWDWIMEAFAREAATANRSDFESLILQTTGLHHRGIEVLNPDRGPQPIPSAFVRRMPENQAKIEAERYERQGRHVLAYQQHIRQCLEHFVTAWTALIDGCSICDWEMIDDEFPKLAQLQEEAGHAFAIWADFDR